jgi:hypothetical protein
MARLHIYRTYRWIDKDPVIYAVKTVIRDEKLKNKAVHEITGVGAATLDGWFNGDTRQPKNSTVTAVTSGLGYVRHDKLNPDGTVEISFEKARALDWRAEIEKQADFLLKHGTAKQKKALARRRKKVPSNGPAPKVAGR